MIDSTKELYLVPYDFSGATEGAFQYALNLSHENGGKIILAHVAKTRDDSYDAEVKFVEIMKGFDQETRDLVTYEVIVGSIYDDLDKIARLTHCTCIIMGVHGIGGFQRVFGSHAQKMVGHSSSPFILVQEDQKKDKIKSIVMPFSFDRESVQVTGLAATIAHNYDATIHLVGFRHSDEWLSRDVKINEKIVRDHLTKHGIKHDTHILQGKGSYEDELMEYAQSVDADLISVAYFVRGVMSYYHSFLDTMMMNKHKIPILTINAPEVMTLNSRFTFITG